jgi:hypothetical protein
MGKGLPPCLSTLFHSPTVFLSTTLPFSPLLILLYLTLVLFILLSHMELKFNRRILLLKNFGFIVFSKFMKEKYPEHERSVKLTYVIY